MTDKVFTEENGVYQFDFSAADWATDKLHDMFQENGVIWSDADFVCEYLVADEKEKINLLFVEYKNANVSGAVKPEAFEPMSDKKVNNVARKYIDSISYLLATRPVQGKKSYVYIVEWPNSDSTTRRFLREKIAKKLPFEFQKQPQFEKKLIDKFEVLSLEEWNSHSEYSRFPITMVEEQ